MKKVIAFEANEIFSFEYGGVIWKVAPLPHGIKKRLSKESTVAIQSKATIGDMIDVCMDAIKYGLKGWEGLNYSDGRPVSCVLTKDKNGVECLDEKSIEMIYRTSAFDEISKYCLNPNTIPKHIEESVELGEGEEAFSPEPLEGEKKNN